MNSYPAKRPEVSGPYLVSIKDRLGKDEYYFKAICFYSVNTELWSKYDSFDFENPVKEITESEVVGWISTGESFLG
ncbi:MAG TPA: hypothetical protein VFD29_05780 [Gillisia sp.]|nr:hypothetical protein [Gillisia sp.]